MHKRAIALVAMLLAADIVAAQPPPSIPLQQRARQFVQPAGGAAAQVAAPAFASPAYYAHQQALTATAAHRALRTSAEQAVEEIPTPRPALTAPSLAPSPATPGLVKAPGAAVRPPIRRSFDPSSADRRPVAPAPRILPSALQTASSGTGKAPQPLDETKPATPPGDPFATPPGAAPPEEKPVTRPAENPLDSTPAPVFEPPTEAPTETPAEPAPETPPEALPGKDMPAEGQPKIPADTFDEQPPRTKPRQQTTTPPRSGGAPRELNVPSTTQPYPPRPAQGIPMPGGTPPGPGAHYTGPDGSGYGPPGEDYFDGGFSAPVVGLGGATFSGYYDRYCPPEFSAQECTSCRLPGGTWATFDYLMWWSQGATPPALVTTGSQNSGGSLSDPSVKVIFGNKRIDNDLRSGGRLNVGTWMNCERTFGFGGAFFDLQRSVTNFDASSNGNPLLARPFFDTVTRSNDSIVVARNGVSSGLVHARTTNDLIAADAFMRIALDRGRGGMLDFVQGYRFLQINDTIRIDDKIVSTDPNGPIPLGTFLAGTDQFSATNQFHGWQFGLLGERRIGRITLASAVKLGIGNMRQTVNIYGSSLVQVPDVPAVVRSGNLLAQPSNIGRYARDTFGFIPEFNLNLGYQITPRLRTNLGYTFLWVNRVAQAGRQISTSVDSNQLFGQPGNAPTFHWQQNGYWAQGLNLGIDYRF